MSNLESFQKKNILRVFFFFNSPAKLFEWGKWVLGVKLEQV